MFEFVTAGRCLMRALLLLPGGSPKTPLRVLAIAALDFVHRHRASRPIPRSRLRDMALCLDYQANTNAMWDHKRFDLAGYDVVGRRLEIHGQAPRLAEYGARLQRLEMQRPAMGGGVRELAEARAYREAVAQVSLATVAAIAFEISLDTALGKIDNDADLNALFRLTMQCQIVDDVLDYDDDLLAGLPSFLTGATSMSVALDSAAVSVHNYGAIPVRAELPLHVALSALTLLTKIVLRASSWRHHSVRGWLPKYS